MPTKQYLSPEELSAVKQKYAGNRQVLINDRLHIHPPSDTRLDAKIKRALLTGKTVVENGVAQWIEPLPIFTPTKSDPFAYTWDETRKLIKAEKVHFTRSEVDGKVTVAKRSLGEAWINFREYNAGI